MNLFEHHNIPFLGEEESLPLVSGKSWRVEKIVSNAHVSPPDFWYEQLEAEFAVVLKGFGEIEFEEGEICKLSAGEWLHIPPGKRHRVKSTSENPLCTWLCFYIKEE